MDIDVESHNIDIDIAGPHSFVVFEPSVSNDEGSEMLCTFVKQNSVSSSMKNEENQEREEQEATVPEIEKPVENEIVQEAHQYPSSQPDDTGSNSANANRDFIDSKPDDVEDESEEKADDNESVKDVVEEVVTQVIAQTESDKCDVEGGSNMEDDCFMNMSMEEKKRFLAMVESLKKKAEELEHNMHESKKPMAQSRTDREEEVHMILLAKQREAARENEKLEKMNMKQVADKLEKWQAFQKQEQDKIRKLQYEKEKYYQELMKTRQQNKSSKEEGDVLSDAASIPSMAVGGASAKSHPQQKNVRKDANSQT